MAGGIRDNGHNGRRRPGQYRAMSEINVTPFVDVMLVLLVVFMITAPLLSVGVPVDLPEATTSTLKGKDEPLTVTVNKEGEVFLMEHPVTLEQLGPRLKAIAGNRDDLRIYVRGDKVVNYGAVMEVIGAINAAGYRRVALVAETPKTSGQKTGG